MSPLNILILTGLQTKEDFHIFQGTHIESGSTLIFRLSRLQEGLCQAFIVLRVNKGDTLSIQNEIKLDLSDTHGYYGCGLKLECLAPMRRWRVNYNGLMKNQEDRDIHVKFSGMSVTRVIIFVLDQYSPSSSERNRV